MKIYDFTVKNRKGEDVSLENFKGKVLLIVNTATRCGFTPQYDELEALYSKYNKDGFEVLDFPCNQFGNQAPESDDEIHTFCQLNYKVKFDQFAKVEVNGENAIPLFKYLKEQKGFTGFDPKHKLTSILNEMLSKNDPDFAKKSVAVQKGSIQENIAKANLSDANVVSLAQPGEAINELKSGQVEGVVLEKAIAKGYVDQNSDLAVSDITLKSDSKDAYAVAMPKGSDKLKAKVNKVIAKLKKEGKIDSYVQDAYTLSLKSSSK